MKYIRFINHKIRLIYTSPVIYLMMFLQVSFLVIYMYVNKTASVSNYVYILKTDFFVWIICIPIMVIQHKVSIFSTYYNCISRIGCKRRMILVDYFTMAISTCISTFIVLCTPLILLFIMEKSLVSQEMFANLLFLMMRYVLLGLFIQYIIYSIMYAFPSLQKKGGSICVMPFLLFFALTFPMEFLATKGQYIPILDFSAGKNYSIIADGIVLWDSIFIYNIHLVGYLVLYMWITVNCLSKGWEFLENESVCAL